MIKLGNVHWNSLPGPEDITRVELQNGITVLVRSNFNSPSVVLGGYLSCGSVYDNDDKLGLSYLTALSLMRGTDRRDFQAIYDALESVGASLGFGSSIHTTSFTGRALVDDLPLLFTTLAESLRQPTFPQDQVERLRAQILTALAIRSQDTDEMASLEFDRCLFPSHPYGRPESGYPETVQAIQRQDLIDFHRQYYGPRQMVLVMVGGVEAAQVLDVVNATLGDWQNPDQPESIELDPPQPLPSPHRAHVEIPGKSQTDLMMGNLGPRRRSEDYLPALLGNSVLGQFGMMGRIGDVVREQAGLAYYASTSLSSWIAAGSWEVSAGVNPANLKAAIDLIQQEILRFTSEPVTNEELQDSQSNFIGRLPLSMESNAGVVNALLNLERFDLGLDYYQKYPSAIAGITPASVLDVARKYLTPESTVTVSAGTSPGDTTDV
ncbi:MAG: insulinase family protein [Anaerolineae bacterium]|nr:insulinase family protein [Anaerolineae bacterium]